MPATRASARRRARDASASDDDAPEEVSGRGARADVARRRGDERAARAAAEARDGAARVARRRAEDARARARAEARATTTAAAMAAAAADDELEALPARVVDAVFGEKKRARRDDDALDAREARAVGRNGERKKKKGKKARRRAYERDGFDVVALDAEDDDDGGTVPKTASDFMRARLMEKHARSGEMLRDVRTGRIPNAFARRVTTRERARRGGRIPM